MNSSPAARPVMFASCRRIEHLHLADADLGVDDEMSGVLAGRRQRRVAVDAYAAFVLVEESDLAEPGVSVEFDDDIARHADEDMADSDGGLHVFGGPSLERDVREIEPELADAEVVLILQLVRAE